MPLCSDEIYWGEIRATNLPPRLSTTVFPTQNGDCPLPAYRRVSYLLTLTVLCVGGLICCFVRINTRDNVCYGGWFYTSVYKAITII